MLAAIKQKMKNLWQLSAPPEPEEPEPEAEPRFIGKVEGLTTVHNVCSFIDDEAWRYPLNYVLVNPVEQHIVATDSRSLILVPLSKFNGQRTEGDETFLVDGKSLSRAFKNYEQESNSSLESKSSLRNTMLTVFADEKTVRIDSISKSEDEPTRHLVIEHDAYEPCEKEDKRRFPKYQDILDNIKEDDFTLSICLDARRLKPVIDHAIAVMGDDYSCLRFRFKNSEEAVHITLLPDSSRQTKDKEPPNPLATYIVMPLEPFDCDKPKKPSDD